MVLRWTVNFASTRSAQIATLAAREEYKKQELCLHTLRADCNAIIIVSGGRYKLCLHTLRADCNSHRRVFLVYGCPFASTRSAQIATYRYLMLAYIDRTLPPHAPRRLQRGGRIPTLYTPATLPPHAPRRLQPRKEGLYADAACLCLHTLRADCNAGMEVSMPCLNHFASTRSAQIATPPQRAEIILDDLCLHTLRADCNG